MIGQIWHFDTETQDGLIIGRDNQRYRFSMIDYHNNNEPVEGNMVDFKVEGQSAKEIILMTSATSNI